MDLLFYKLTDNFDIPIDGILNELKSFDATSYKNEENAVGILQNTNKTIWQEYEYPKNIQFLRSWNSDYKNIIRQSLMKLQYDIRITDVRNNLIDAFLNSKFSEKDITATKVIGDVDEHKDLSRNYAITIGLENSDDYKTYASYTTSKKDFSYADNLSYAVGIKEVYITNVKNFHGLKAINTKTVRYGITVSCQE